MKYQIIVMVDGGVSFACIPQEISPEDFKAFEDEALKRETSVEMLILEAATSDWDENDAVQIFQAKVYARPYEEFSPWALLTSKIMAMRVALIEEDE